MEDTFPKDETGWDETPMFSLGDMWFIVTASKYPAYRPIHALIHFCPPPVLFRDRPGVVNHPQREGMKKACPVCKLPTPEAGLTMIDLLEN